MSILKAKKSSDSFLSSDKFDLIGRWNLLNKSDTNAYILETIQDNFFQAGYEETTFASIGN